MLSEKPAATSGGIRLETLLDASHPLVKLTQRIDWEHVVKQFGKLYSEEGRPSVPIRVVVGLHYLKSLYNESDESVVAKWVDVPPVLAILLRLRDVPACGLACRVIRRVW